MVNAEIQSCQSLVSDQELSDFFEFLRFKSVSTVPEHHQDCCECAKWVADYLGRCGLNAEVRPTSGLPVVVAKNQHRRDRPTVLVYGHYDVQPADPLELWNHPPFDPIVKDGVITARGATDNKGQIFSHMLGQRRIAAAGRTVPVNLLFLIEGEEEIGSPNLAPFLKTHHEEFRCNTVIVSDTGMVADDRPTLTYGLRGIAALEVCLTGPQRDLHSGIFGGAVMNPAVALSKVLSALHDSQGKVTIPGFYNDVRQVADWERQVWSDLPINDGVIRDLTGAPVLWGETGYSTLERMWARPTAEINGMYSGYTGPGTKTIIPSQAVAKITFRLVPSQDPAWILKCAEEFLQKLCPPACKIDVRRGHTGEPYYLDPQGPLGKIAVEALIASAPKSCSKPALICEGGSVPIVADFKKILGADTILVGMALPDCRIHSPNENFPIKLLHYGATLHMELLQRLGEIQP